MSMRIGLSLPTMLAGIDGATVRDWCHRIEGDGYDSIGFGERIAYHNLELFSVLATAAAVTERVRIMSTVVVLPMHSEVWIAKQSATMHVLSDGRYTLGVGVGGRSGDYRALERDDRRRFERLDRQVGRIRSVWAGEPVATDDGTGGDPVGPRPAAGAIPILSAAMGPRSLERSAHWADGIAGFELDPSTESLRGTRQRVDSAWEQAGRTDAPYRMTSFWFGLGHDGPARLHAYAADYLGVFGEATAHSMADLCTASSADAVLAAIDAAEELGFDEIQLVPTTTDLAELDRLNEVIARR